MPLLGGAIGSARLSQVDKLASGGGARELLHLHGELNISEEMVRSADSNF
jgi:hypothetical protein